MDKYIKQLKTSAFLLVGLAYVAISIEIQSESLNEAFTLSNQLLRRYTLVREGQDQRWEFRYDVHKGVKGRKAFDIRTGTLASESVLTTIVKLARRHHWFEGSVAVRESVPYLEAEPPKAEPSKAEPPKAEPSKAEPSTPTPTALREVTNLYHVSATYNDYYKLTTLTISCQDDEDQDDFALVATPPDLTGAITTVVSDSDPPSWPSVSLHRRLVEVSRDIADAVGASGDDPDAVATSIGSKIANQRVKVPILDAEVPVGLARGLLCLLSMVESYAMYSALLHLRWSKESSNDEILMLSQSPPGAAKFLDRLMSTFGRGLNGAFFFVLLITPTAIGWISFHYSVPSLRGPVGTTLMAGYGVVVSCIAALGINHLLRIMLGDSGVIITCLRRLKKFILRTMKLSKNDMGS